MVFIKNVVFDNFVLNVLKKQQKNSLFQKNLKIRLFAKKALDKMQNLF